ncbi:MAG: signal recognition particle-docking protein FtsY [Myxococcales bacterium]|nr:signal recognition particle-docking protein FtsY [Myxococcales bacterium]
MPAPFIPTSSLLLIAQAGAEPGADLTGVVVVLGFLVAIAGGAFVLTRKKRGPAPKGVSRIEDREQPEETLTSKEKEARRAAKALRRAAKGGLRVDADGKAEKLEAVDLAGQQKAAEEAAAAEAAAQEASQQAAIEALRQAANKGAAEAEARDKVRGGLSKTRNEGFVARLGKLFAGKQIDENLLDQIEEVLYRADLGVQATEALLGALKQALSKQELGDADKVWDTLQDQSLQMLDKVATGELLLPKSHGPAVLMVVGVNGSGKTTTIGKLAHRYAAENRKILIAAGDTFRAAAVDQLEVWCERAGVDMFRGKPQQDPASVCYGAIEKGKAEGYDLVICDTAGRLHTNANLMAELQKVRRVIGKAHDGAPHEVLLVLDATMGQNAVAQARQFGESIEVTSIALTKLDGTAKGGVILAIAETLGIPVKLIGVGEQMSDLRDFNAKLFVEMLFERDAA